MDTVSLGREAAHPVELRGNIPTFLHISHGNVHDVNILDQLVIQVGDEDFRVAGARRVPDAAQAFGPFSASLERSAGVARVPCREQRVVCYMLGERYRRF